MPLVLIKTEVLDITEEMMRLNSIVVRVEDSGRISRNTWMETIHYSDWRKESKLFHDKLVSDLR